MELPLPLDQFRFNLILWILITAYGASGIGNFIAFIPGCTKEDAEILGCHNKSNYSFWLISSLIFFLLGISQFRYPMLICISTIEIYIIIIVYLFLIIQKRHYINSNIKKEKEIKKKRLKEINERGC